MQELDLKLGSDPNRNQRKPSTVTKHDIKLHIVDKSGNQKIHEFQKDILKLIGGKQLKLVKTQSCKQRKESLGHWSQIEGKHNIKW